MKASWIVLGMAIIMAVIGTYLSEPTALGRWHPLIGDAIIMSGIWAIMKKQDSM